MKADLVFMNGKVITVDSKDSTSEAIAVYSGRIIKVGSNREVEKCIGQETRVIDLGDKAVTPGMIDVHCHFADSGTSKVYVVDLRYPNVESISEVLKIVEAQVSKAPRGMWIKGRGWDEALFQERRYITRWDLDSISPENPVILHHTSGHYISVNTYVLQLAGVTKDTPQPAGGTIDKDPESREPTGVFKEAPAMNLVLKKVPEWTVLELETGIKKAQELFLSEGITAIKDPGVTNATLHAYNNLQNCGELAMRVYMLYPVNTVHQTERAVKHLARGGNDFLKLGGLKMFLDGSGMARTAWMYEDWNQHYIHRDVNNRGYPVIPLKDFRMMVKIAHKAGFQIGVHAIGDKAIDETLTAYEAALKEVPKTNSRHSIIHANVPTDEALERITKLKDNIVIETQTPFLYFIGDNYAGNFGPQRAKRMIPMKTYMKQGITVGNSSDWSVCPFPPRIGIWSAIVRKTWKGLYGFHPFGIEEGLSVQEALRTYTILAAKCIFMEELIGSIEEKKYADLVVWSRDLYTTPIDKLKDLTVEMTIVGGKIVYGKDMAG
ncbi:MAG: amidohydrolase [Candidatus Bathyarchaeota archaeon]|nr:MAG: amidohydrolase [Candidatus Bathyarchaeota archaeon]